MIQYIDGKQVRNMFVSGANNLKNHKDLVDKLNVFPVPDGDTGTNMSLTISCAIKELNKVEKDDIGQLGKALSKGSLMGARGNSGVILSQIIRGIAQSIDGKEILTSMDIAKALKNGSDIAYKAVIKPVEGTILTVVRESSEYALKAAVLEEDIIEFMKLLVKEANNSLNRTPELLHALKEAGVVDSGGKGLVLVYEGMLKSLEGQFVESQEVQTSETSAVQVENKISTEDIKFQYCTEFILETDKISDIQMRDKMLKYGDSLVVVGDDGIIKVHVHTNTPGDVLQEALAFGQLLTIKIENMKLQHENKVIQDAKESEVEEQAVSEEPKEFGFIATSMGDGLAKIFKDFGVDHIIEGGQTMNPSTEDFVKAVEELNARNIIILPNNKNILMAAQSAAEVIDQPAAVVETKTIPQGLTSLLAFDESKSIEENYERMSASLGDVVSGSVTTAVRDTTIDGLEIHENDNLGMVDGKIVVSNPDMMATLEETFAHMLDEDSEIVTIYVGEDGSEELANELAQALAEKYEDVEVEIHQGGQPVYPYLFSVE